MPILEALGIHFDPNILVTLGIVLVVTFLGSKIFQRLGIPPRSWVSSPSGFF
jgi:hypothetical protein